MLESSPIISVIVPVYNVGDFLYPSLNSIKEQTYKNLEILLINDGSTDGSGDRCDEYAKDDSRFKVFHKENGGVSSARNLGLDMATGDYIAFVDSDDVLAKDYFEVLLRDMVEQNVDIVYCNIIDIDEQGNPLMANGAIKEKERLQDLESILNNCVYKKGRNYFVIYASLIKKELLSNIRFNSFAFGEDSYYMFEVLFTNPSVYLDDYTGYYYVRRASSVTIHTAYTDLKRRIAYLEVFSFIYNNLKNFALDIQDSFLEKYAREAYQIAHYSSSLKNSKERQYYRNYLDNHLKEIIPLRKRFVKQWGNRLVMYVKYPEIYSFIARLVVFVKRAVKR